jgi:hypothetical protein
MYLDTWIVCDCANNIVGLPNPDKDLVSQGGLLTPLWTWKPSSAGFTFDSSPTLATPFIDASWTTPTMYVLYKGQTSDPMLFALNLVLGGSVAPTLKWKINLAQQTFAPNDQGQTPLFRTFSEDHSIFAYGGKVWLPSQDYAGALIVDSQSGTKLLTTTALYFPTQRLRGSVGGQGMGWRAPVFVAHGSGYGIQSFDPDSGNRSWWSDNPYNAYAEEFSHPVAVSFMSWQTGATNCVIVSQWDQTGDIFLTGANANSSGPCGYWNPNGYTIRHSYIAQPLWVSAPAVLYDGNQLAYLVYAVTLPSGDGRGRSSWRSTLVTIQIDVTGPYSDPVDYYTLDGCRFNAAPLIVRNAWGYNNHVITVGATNGRLYVFPAQGYTRTGPFYSHNLIPLLPPPNNPAYPGVTNVNVGISGNYMAASRGGSIGFIMHNEDAETNFFGVVAGAMFRLPTDVSPSPSPSVGPPSPNNGGSNSAVNSGVTPAVSIAGAAFGGVAALLAALVAIVFLAPSSSAAEAVRYVASSILGGARSAASGLSPSKRAFVGATSGSPIASGGSYGAAAPSASSGLLGASRL